MTVPLSQIKPYGMVKTIPYIVILNEVKNLKRSFAYAQDDNVSTIGCGRSPPSVLRSELCTLHSYKPQFVYKKHKTFVATAVRLVQPTENIIIVEMPQ